MSDITFTLKSFEDFTASELYRALQLRSAVFVVEQDCVYQDIDGKDQKALHVLGYKGDQLIAYTRIFKAGDYFKEASIGRVVVMDSQRKYGYGYDLMKATVAAIYTELGEQDIRISAQTYLMNFYNKLGFQETGETYLEDGIPHINMVKRKRT